MHNIILEKEHSKYICPTLSRECVGDKCMAWKWEPEYRQPRYHLAPPDIVGYSDTKGYCGLVE